MLAAWIGAILTAIAEAANAVKPTKIKDESLDIV
jgi:hypothetical protein